MKSSVIIWTIVAIVVVVGIALASSYGLFTPLSDTVNTPIGNEPVACTMDAKICPDGSYVGRTGPNCEFALCPVINATTTPSTDAVVLALNKSATIKAITISPLEVVEDSRCPLDVQCIQAGTVRVRTSLSDIAAQIDETFTLNVSKTFRGHSITLTEVSPAPYSTQPSGSRDYRFTFLIK